MVALAFQIPTRTVILQGLSCYWNCDNNLLLFKYLWMAVFLSCLFLHLSLCLFETYGDVRSKGEIPINISFSQWLASGPSTMYWVTHVSPLISMLSWSQPNSPCVLVSNLNSLSFIILSISVSIRVDLQYIFIYDIKVVFKLSLYFEGAFLISQIKFRIIMSV